MSRWNGKEMLRATPLQHLEASRKTMLLVHVIGQPFVEHVLLQQLQRKRMKVAR